MKKEIACILLSAFLMCFAAYAPAQTKFIDSVRQIISKSASDQEKLDHILTLSGQTINPDTLLPYVIVGEMLTARSKNKFDMDRIAVVRANYYVRKNYIDSALTIVDRIIPFYQNNKKHQDFYLNVLFLKSKILDRGNRYTQALTQLYEVVETAESLKDTLTLIQAKTGIGWVQMEMEQYHEALQWLYKALYTSPDKKFYKNYGALYSNIASTYNALGKADSATLYITTAINDARENNNLLFLATALNMEAKIFIDNKQTHLAEAPLHEAVEIRKKLNDPFYTVYDMSSLASYYATNNQAAKGIELCKEGIMLAKQSGLSSQLLMIYRSLAENYKAAGKINEYSTTLELIIALKDSFNNINSSKLLADMQFSSEAQKKEKTIVEQKLNLTIKNYWLFGSALFAVMAIVIVWLGFKNYNRKQNIKMELALAEEKRISAQSIIDAEEQERKRIATDLHDNIGAYASAIRADVEKISNNGFEKNNHALNNLQQHSQEIINSLRDTIWVLNKENITITGISDRIKNYINKLQPTYDTIQLEIKEEICNDVRLSSQHALNIFRIIQEAIHNALKHSGATQIAVTINSKESILISITDNGKGIATDIAAGGNGMSNMKARAKQTGMELLISSAKNQGTVLELHGNTTN
ncbi:ATP-binding protein [Ferruginibacter sp. SUN106]|uniref:sensor histidine kinase n=1 Tax=Ferruginibacter sp. SUN106 TaxID=2978348 RepID=UPI003D35A5EA